MTATSLIEALHLPADTGVNQRVAKRLLTENGAPTAADKRHIQDGIDELIWVASLKPNTIGVEVYRDDCHDYLEIAVLHATMRSGAKVSRLIELIHRAIPYPVVLITDHGTKLIFSLAHKRLSQGEGGQIVLEEPMAWAELEDGDGPETGFMESLELASLPQQNLFSLYQGWMDRVTALAVARLTGSCATAPRPEAAKACREALDEHALVVRNLTLLRNQAAKEKQLNRRVELNLAIQRLEKELTEITHKLAHETVS